MTSQWIGLALAWGLLGWVRHRQRKAARRAAREEWRRRYGR